MKVQKQGGGEKRKISSYKTEKPGEIQEKHFWLVVLNFSYKKGENFYRRNDETEKALEKREKGRRAAFLLHLGQRVRTKRELANHLGIVPHFQLSNNAAATSWTPGASPTGPSSNGQPDVENLLARIMGNELSEPSEPG
jgi:hypothetical protein